MPTVLITGSRTWQNLDAMIRELEQLPANTRLIHGDCRGADKMAAEIGQQLGFEVIAVPANWKQHGKAAGPLRNRKMLNDYDPDLVLAFHENIAESKGTKDMISYAQTKGCKVKLISK